MSSQERVAATRSERATRFRLVLVLGVVSTRWSWSTAEKVWRIRMTPSSRDTLVEGDVMPVHAQGLVFAQAGP